MDDVTKHQHSGGSFQHGELRQSHIAAAFVTSVLAGLVRFGMTSTIVRPSDQFELKIFVHTEKCSIAAISARSSLRVTQ